MRASARAPRLLLGFTNRIKLRNLRYLFRPRRVEDRADGARGAVRSWRGVGPRNTRGIERVHAYARHGVSDVHAVVRPATAAFQGLPKLKPIPYTPSSLFSLSLLFFSSSSPSSLRRHTLRHDILPPRLAHPFTSPWRFFFLLLSRFLSPLFCPSYRLSRESPRESRPSTLNEIYILILTLSLSLLLPPLSLSLSLILWTVMRHLARSHRHHRISFAREILRGNAHHLALAGLLSFFSMEDRFNFIRGARLPHSAPFHIMHRKR